MPRFAANLSMMFTDVPFLDRFEAAAKAGFAVSSASTSTSLGPGRRSIASQPPGWRFRTTAQSRGRTIWRSAGSLTGSGWQPAIFSSVRIRH
jgi:hypothetical protein